MMNTTKNMCQDRLGTNTPQRKIEQKRCPQARTRWTLTRSLGWDRRPPRSRGMMALLLHLMTMTTLLLLAARCSERQQ